MPQSLTTICTGGSSLAAIDCADDTPDVSRTDLLGMADSRAARWRCK